MILYPSPILPAGRLVRRAGLLTLGAALLLPSVAPALAAQASSAGSQVAQQHHRTPRRVVLALVGAGVGVALAGAYATIGHGNNTPGNCTGVACVATFTVAGGALVGYMVGREYDQVHALRYRNGAPLNPASISAPLTGEPQFLSVNDTMVAVGGSAGVQLFRSGLALGAGPVRATGVRGIEAVALVPGSNAIAVGAPTGLFLFPPASGPGVMLRQGRASAAAVVPGSVVFSIDTRVERAPVSADSARSWPGIDLARHVDLLTSDPAHGLVWALADSVLVALRPAGDSLEEVGRLALDGQARRLAIQGDRMAVAMGEGGVRLVDVHDPAAPRELARWTSARYVYDVSFAGARLFAASGIEGVYVLSAAGDRLTALGLARELGFSTAVESRGGYTYVIDRTSNSLRRFRSEF